MYICTYVNIYIYTVLNIMNMEAQPRTTGVWWIILDVQRSCLESSETRSDGILCHLGKENHRRMDKFNNYFSNLSSLKIIFCTQRPMSLMMKVGNGTEPQDGRLTNKHERMWTGRVVVIRENTVTQNQQHRGVYQTEQQEVKGSKLMILERWGMWNRHHFFLTIWGFPEMGVA